MSVHAAPIAIGGLKFHRVMAGEYYAELPGGRCTIDHRWEGCGECDHSHDWWHAELYRGPVRFPCWTAKCRTLTDAKIAVAERLAEQ